MKCYLSYSLNDATRYKASSGGFCKEFIKYCVERNVVDKAIVTLLGDGPNALISGTIITSDVEKILSTKSNSIYDKTNPLSILKNLNKDESYIFVGMPCHILPIKKYCESKNIKMITVSLFCNHTSNNKYYKSILNKAGLIESDIKHFEYRGSGWPGFTSMVTNDGKEIRIDYPSCWSNYEKEGFDMVPKCKKCVKFISQDADICVGDAWLQRVIAIDKKGTCIVLSMNTYADGLIKDCFKKAYIHLEQMGTAEFEKLNESMMNYKQNRLKT